MDFWLKFVGFGDEVQMVSWVKRPKDNGHSKATNSYENICFIKSDFLLCFKQYIHEMASCNTKTNILNYSAH